MNVATIQNRLGEIYEARVLGQEFDLKEIGTLSKQLALRALVQARRLDKPEQVAIVGFGPGRLCAPFGQKGWECWGLNDISYPSLDSFDRFFQLHNIKYCRRHYPTWIQNDKLVWERSQGLPLYMDRHYKSLPDSVPYPKKDVEKLTSHGKYHTSSFDWMVALAIHLEVKEIALYGVNFSGAHLFNGEPLAGRACLEYWLGVAEGRGIKVMVSGGSDLFKTVHLAGMMSTLQYGFGGEPGLELGNGWRDVR